MWLAAVSKLVRLEEGRKAACCGRYTKLSRGREEKSRHRLNGTEAFPVSRHHAMLKSVTSDFVVPVLEQALVSSPGFGYVLAIVLGVAKVLEEGKKLRCVTCEQERDRQLQVLDR